MIRSMTRIEREIEALDKYVKNDKTSIVERHEAMLLQITLKWVLGTEKQLCPTAMLDTLYKVNI